ncbi:hypothetical protein [Sporichthya polymorpha]|uniref:hypothetical protein n=1 Tax=Sporichthya polymorpha TaxID=35751 RepID=UPI00037F7B15|nr:hypothetical protein [Sporichthya polymorpha]
MAYFVLAAWLLQAVVGVVLLVGWNRHRQQAGVMLGHVTFSVGGLVPWVAFLVTDRALWGWVALGLITAGNTLGDEVLRGRWRRLSGQQSSLLRDYGAAIGAAVTGRFPPPVTFHALFAGVVYFAALIACLTA